MRENWPKDTGLDVVIERIGVDYEVLEYVGGGGLSNIYKVRHKLHGEVRALKIMDVDYLSKIFEKGNVKNIHEKFDNITQRFTREAKIFKKISHPNIARVIDIGFVKDKAKQIEVPYLLMEYIEGRTLGDMLRKKSSLDIGTITRLCEDILPALDEIHKANVIHRDIKPANIMIDKNNGRAILIDFGLARDMADEKSLTMSGVIGTPAYIAPEIFSRKKDIGPEADIYSFGIMLYEMLAGEKPFEGENQLELIYESLNIAIPDVTKKNPAVPVSLQKIIKKAAAKDPGDRYQSAAELLEAIKNVKKEKKQKPGSKSFKYLVYLLVIIAAAAFILVNPLGIGKSTEKQYLTYVSSAKQFNLTGEYVKAMAELEKAKKIKDTEEIKELEAGIQRSWIKKDFQLLEELLKGEAAKEEKLAACRDFLSKHQNFPANDETKLLVSQTNEFIAQLEKEINAEKTMEQYQKHFAAAVEHFNKGELDKSYESVKSAQEVMNTSEAKELEEQIINVFVSAVENYYKQANYAGARQSLDQAKKIIPGRNFQDLEHAVELLKEMPDHAQAVLRESKIKETRIDRKNNWWQADFGDGIVMVYIPAGNFKKGDSTELTSLQDIYLDGYWMGKTEVSTAQYMKFARESGTKYPEGIEMKGNDYPIVEISWDDAAVYCQWLSEKTGLACNLPSEAQWEKAARGTDGRKYPWGNQEPDRTLANFLNPSTSTDKVNSHPRGASPYGILNMAGNAAEWCGDELTGKEHNRRPARGGSFYNNAQDIACYSRRTWSPSERINTLGFRVCLETRKEGR